MGIFNNSENNATLRPPVGKLLSDPVEELVGVSKMALKFAQIIWNHSCKEFYKETT